jgi:hypothetical protein
MMVNGLYGQSTDSILNPAKNLKNTIKLNVSSNLIYRNSYVMSFERVVNKHQSISIIGGYQEFPLKLDFNLLDTKLEKTKKKSGYSVGVVYRFYPAKANKCLTAPQGVYLGPFVGLQHFQSERGFSHTYNGVTSTADLRSSINLLFIGGELGYQFVLWKRLVIDAEMFGPAITRYNFNAKLSADLPGLDSNEALQKVIDALKEKFPKLDDLSGEHGISSSGTESFWSIGFKYTISIGFRF